MRLVDEMLMIHVPLLIGTFSIVSFKTSPECCLAWPGFLPVEVSTSIPWWCAERKFETSVGCVSSLLAKTVSSNKLADKSKILSVFPKIYSLAHAR